MFQDVPEGWPKASDDVLGTARAVVGAVLKDVEAVERNLTAYYTRESDYAGSTFTDLNPNDPYALEGSDLLAVHMLSVDIPQVAVRRLVESGETSAHLGRVLREKPLDPAQSLVTADAVCFEAMSRFYDHIKTALHPVRAKTSNARVTASKICARKRPNLFPVRDKRVLSLIGTWGLRDYGIDWQVFRMLVQDDELMSQLRDVVDLVRGKEGVSVGDPNGMLRHLDVALWMHSHDA